MIVITLLSVVAMVLYISDRSTRAQSQRNICLTYNFFFV